MAGHSSSWLLLRQAEPGWASPPRFRCCQPLLRRLRPRCCRLERQRGAEAAAAALLGAVVFALDAQQEAGAPAALRAMLGPAASVGAALVQHGARQKAKLPLTPLMHAVAALLLDCSKADLAAFTADLATAEAALRCAVALGHAVAARGSAQQRTQLWAELVPAAFKAIRKLGALHALQAGGSWGLCRCCAGRCGGCCAAAATCAARCCGCRCAPTAAAPAPPHPTHWPSRRHG